MVINLKNKNENFLTFDKCKLCLQLTNMQEEFGKL